MTSLAEGWTQQNRNQLKFFSHLEDSQMNAHLLHNKHLKEPFPHLFFLSHTHHHHQHPALSHRPYLNNHHLTPQQHLSPPHTTHSHNGFLNREQGQPRSCRQGRRHACLGTRPLCARCSEYERKSAESEENNEEERELEKTERFEYEKQTRLAAAERLARMQGNQPKNESTNSFRQKENIHVSQPILHNHSKSGAAAMGQH
ncbi:MAG: hypothetical protein BYD32DRAFT_99102 [Podila humilis]|nr:MAG: hypothetical protein BYD32DRAFT_99102 [Podila humilis]